MTSNLEIYTQQSESFDAVVGGIVDWDAASPCDGWTARDVLEHVVGTQREFLAGQGLELGAQPDLADPLTAWRSHDARVRALLADPAVADREFQGFFGPATIGATLVRFYGFDLIVHRWDLAASAGRDERFTDAELDTLELAMAGFGENLYGDGICKPALEVPEGAGCQTSVLARLGRRAQVNA